MTPIYHISHYKNVKSILASQAIFCHRAVGERGLAHEDISESGVQERRATRRIVVDGVDRGSVHDYVPFYFENKSPMLYLKTRSTRARGRVEQKEIFTFRTSVEKVMELHLEWVFSDGNAAAKFTEFFADVAQLAKIDWELMRAKIWRNTDEDGDRRRRRGAEFLVRDRVPWAAIEEIGVLTEGAAGWMREQLAEAAVPPVAVQVQPDWYY